MPLLRVENLSKSFGAQAAVRGVSLEINRGEIFVVMGLSGSGKSTLLRMLNGLIHPSQGDVQVDGQWLSQLSGQELRKSESFRGSHRCCRGHRRDCASFSRAIFLCDDFAPKVPRRGLVENICLRPHFEQSAVDSAFLLLRRREIL